MYRCGGCDSPAQTKCLCYDVGNDGTFRFTRLGAIRCQEDKYPSDRPLPNPILNPSRLLEISQDLKEKLQNKVNVSSGEDAVIGYVTEYA